MNPYTIVAEFFEGPYDEEYFFLQTEAATPELAVSIAQARAIDKEQRHPDAFERDEDDNEPLKIIAVFPGHHNELYHAV